MVHFEQYYLLPFYNYGHKMKLYTAGIRVCVIICVLPVPYAIFFQIFQTDIKRFLQALNPKSSVSFFVLFSIVAMNLLTLFLSSTRYFYFGKLCSLGVNKESWNIVFLAKTIMKTSIKSLGSGSRNRIARVTDNVNCFAPYF